MFSKACEYAIKASIFITQKSYAGKKVSLKEVSKAIASPEAFTAKILQQLNKHNIILSSKGPNGGFVIEEKMISNNNLIDIVKAIDGTDIFKECGLGLKTCNAKKPCPLHHQFKAIRDELKNTLENTLLISLALGVSNKDAFLKR